MLETHDRSVNRRYCALLDHGGIGYRATRLIVSTRNQLVSMPGHGTSVT